MINLFGGLGKKLSIVSCAATLVFVGQPLYGADDLPPFLQTIQSASDKVQSFESSFVQEKHLALFQNPVVFEGKLAIIRPDKLRWEFLSPLPSILILNENNGVKCSENTAPQYFQLDSDPIMKIVAEQMWLWLGGDYDLLSNSYELEKVGDWTLNVVPKDPQTGQFVESVSIEFNYDSYQPEIVTIHEPGGDKTIIRFTEGQINRSIPANLFSSCRDEG